MTRKALLGLAKGMAASAVALLLGSAGSPASAGEFDGVTVNVVTFTGPQIAEPLQRRAPEFQKLTGAKVNVITVPFSDLYNKVLTDFATGTNSYDVAVFAPQWMVDFIEPGYLEDLTDKVKNDKQAAWDDIGPFFRDFSATYNGKVYTIPLDGDFQMVYYRTDLLKEAGMQPPKTWDDYLAIAKHFHGKDLNGDGKPDYGSCIAKKRNAQSYWMVTSVIGNYIQSKGTSQGVFFDPNDMKPLVNNDAFKAGLKVYVDTTQYGPPDEINLDVGDTRGLFTTGRCALSIDWGDIGTLAIDKTTSKVVDKVGAVIIPGSKQVLDRATGKLVDCTPELCPYAIDGVNHAPFAAFGGWSGAINHAKDQKVKDAAYAFLSYMTAPAESNVDVTIGATGFNPYRTSQFENLDLWLKAGMSKEAADIYLGAIKSSLNSPNMVLDLRIPQNQRYQQIVLDTEVGRLLAKETTIDQAAANIENGWNEITEELGKDAQLKAYQNTLGVKK
ncbi:MAG: sugar ABC transporter substrate-binding protein [Dongiaceae bacterium]